VTSGCPAENVIVGVASSPRFDDAFNLERLPHCGLLGLASPMPPFDEAAK